MWIAAIGIFYVLLLVFFALAEDGKAELAVAYGVAVAGLAVWFL